MDTLERFTVKYVIVEDTCHIWTGALTDDGYAAFRFNGKTDYGHRYAWLEHYGALPPAPLELDHVCRKRCCVNVFHLEAVTRRLNLQRGLGTNTVVCKSGRHPWVPENWTFKRGRPTCRLCINELQRGVR